MYDDIYKKFIACIENRCGLSGAPDRKIVAAVSGGADSVCLLLLLKQYLGADRLLCAHYNHGIRGAEADADEQFTRLLAGRLGIRFVCGMGDVPAYAKAHGMGIEEAARKLRYAFLSEIAESANALVAIAHTKEDNVETILSNITRGTSVEGLRGIWYQRNAVIRPVLDLSRRETEEVCAYHHVSPVYDRTNADLCYKRNRIRLEVLPYLRSIFGNSLDEKLLRLSRTAAVDGDFFQQAVFGAFAECCAVQEKPFPRIVLRIAPYRTFHPALQSRLVRRILSNIRNPEGILIFPESTGVYADMIERVMQAAAHFTPNKKIELSNGAFCVTGYDVMYFTHRACLEDYTAHPDFQIDRFNIVEKELIGGNPMELISRKNSNTEYFDADQLAIEFGKNFEIVCRVNREGDHFTPFGASGGKSLRKYFIDGKLERFERERVVVAAIGSEVLWIPGMRRSAAAAIDKNTSRVIILKYDAQTEVHG